MLNKIIAIITAIVFFVTCYFASREYLSLIIVIPLSLISLYYIEKVGVVFSCLGVVIVCVACLLWVNSITPLFGEEYAAAQEAKAAKNRADMYERAVEAEKSSAITSAHRSVKLKLKDPSSATFSGETVSSRGVVCGHVNAKNSFGAYNGASKYIYLSGSSIIEDEDSSFSDLWKEHCN